MFQVGGVDCLVHKYIGSGSASEGSTPSTPTYSSVSETNIQDVLFLENRDRKYSPDVYVLRGVYNIQDIDFNLSQFGLFLQNDTIFITFHINDTVEKLGRKIISGDVIELPHLKDEYALNDLQFALKRFYVVEDVNRAAEGFSMTWYPHLYRAKCKPLVDSQEFKSILDGAAADGSSTTLRDLMSTYEKEMQITQAILNQAEADAPKSGYNTSMYYTLNIDDATGKAAIVSVDDDTREITADASMQATDSHGNALVDSDGNPIYVGDTASTNFQTAEKPYVGLVGGYLLGDQITPNGAPFTAGIAYPLGPSVGQFCLRTDYMPNRLFRFDGAHWIKFEDNVRMTMDNLGASDVAAGDRFVGKDIRETYKTSFINNTAVDTINGISVPEKQSLSKALRPEAD